jgi:hypothetical protein
MKQDKEKIVQRIFKQGTYTKPPAPVGKAIIRALLDFRATEAATLWTYQSKHVRWFQDGLNGKWPKTAAWTLVLFTNYLEENRNRVQVDIAENNGMAGPEATSNLEGWSKVIEASGRDHDEKEKAWYKDLKQQREWGMIKLLAEQALAEEREGFGTAEKMPFAKLGVFHQIRLVQYAMGQYRAHLWVQRTLKEHLKG